MLHIFHKDEIDTDLHQQDMYCTCKPEVTIGTNKNHPEIYGETVVIHNPYNGTDPWDPKQADNFILRETRN